MSLYNLAVLEIYDCEAVEGGNFDNYQLEVISDVISGVVVDQTGAKIRVKFGDYAAICKFSGTRNLHLSVHKIAFKALTLSVSEAF